MPRTEALKRPLTLIALFAACNAVAIGAYSAVAQAQPTAGPNDATGAAPATSTSPATLISKVQELTAKATALGGKLGLRIVEVQGGKVLAEVNPQLPLNPASNMKVLTAAVLLDRLGPNYHFVTGLYGKKVGSEVAELVLRGRGDPSLSASDLLSLARSLQRSGVTKVGAILVDQSYFDAQFVPPAFDEQPDEWAPFRAPVSAVSVDGNAVTLNVQPTTPGTPARIWFGPEDVFATAGQVLTKEAGSGQHIGWTLKPQSSGLGSVVSGSVAADLSRQQFQKRMHDPRVVPGQALRRMLLDLGVQVGDRVLEGGADAKELLASHESPALSELVTHLGKDSDNFYAETLLKVLGAEQAGAPGTSAAGSNAIIKWLDEHHALVPGTQIINGSGLFNADRVSTATLCATLRAAFLDPRLQPEYVAQLSIAGVDGTLRFRMKSLAAQRSVRGKTGTLNSTVALSGYALGQSPTSAIAFSMIVDGVSGHHSEFRQRFDAIALQLAQDAATAR